MAAADFLAKHREADKKKWCTRSEEKCRAVSQKMYEEYEKYAKSIGYDNSTYIDSTKYDSMYYVYVDPKMGDEWPPACVTGAKLPACSCPDLFCLYCKEHTAWEWARARKMFLKWVESIHSC